MKPYEEWFFELIEQFDKGSMTFDELLHTEHEDLFESSTEQTAIVLRNKAERIVISKQGSSCLFRYFYKDKLIHTVQV